MSHVKSARELQAKSIISALEKRNMTAVYCESAEDCRKKISEIIPAGSVISWGGSMSIHECGIPQLLKDRGDCQVLDRSEYVTPEQQKEFEDYENATISVTAICEEASFVEGFRLGAKMILEVLQFV